MKYRYCHPGDRLLAAAIGIVCAPPAGFGVYYRYTHFAVERNYDWIFRIFFASLFDVVGFAFIGSLLCIIWALFTPAWVESVFGFLLLFSFLSLFVGVVAGVIVGIRYVFS